MPPNHASFKKTDKSRKLPAATTIKFDPVAMKRMQGSPVNKQLIYTLSVLDGWMFSHENFTYNLRSTAVIPRPVWFNKVSKQVLWTTDFPDYLYSYDAVMPLVRKQPPVVLEKINGILADIHGPGNTLKATPHQLATSLVEALSMLDLLNFQ